MLVPANKTAPTKVRGTEPGKSVWSNSVLMVEEELESGMPCCKISCVAWMLKDSSTLVNGDANKWSKTTAGRIKLKAKSIACIRIIRFQVEEYYFGYRLGWA